jgi:phosphoglycolate phosphatase
MKFKVNVVIFDFDGVIIDSGADIASAAQHTLKVFNRPVLSKEEIISYVGHGAEVLIRRCFKDCNKEIIEQAIPFYKKYYLDNALIETTLYPNVKEMLKVIKGQGEDKKIALVTNKPEEISKKILAGLGIRQFFDLILGPESVKKIKPDPEGISKVLDTFGIAAEKAIMVGDSYVDVQAGKNAGTNTCGVTYGLGNKEALTESAPDFYISDMSQLLDHIE